MNVFADTNWLEALYFVPHPGNAEATKRASIVERRMRNQSGPLLTSHVVLLEARNVFSRLSRTPKPEEWDQLVADFSGRIFVDPMNWDFLRQETTAVFEKFSHKAVIGTFDATLIASAKLAGAQEILSFDERLKAVASCCELNVFPKLGPEGTALRAALLR
jgi:predicted nucleic acid-binding protein